MTKQTNTTKTKQEAKLKELIAVARKPGEFGDTCSRCASAISQRWGEEPTPHCDHCAHELVSELADALEMVLGVAIWRIGK